MKQNTVSSGSYGKGGNAAGPVGGGSSSNIGGHDQASKYGQPQMLLMHQSKQASATAATNGTAAAGGASATTSYKSQSHIRQASLQIGPGGVAVGDMTSSTQKMAANHRKNKSMLNN